jgi:hypothetical protein
MRTLAKSGHDGTLFVVAHAGASLTAAAHEDPRVAYAALRDGIVSLKGQRHTTTTASEPTRPPSGRTSWVRFAMLRLFALVDAKPLTQTVIARQLGVSHVAVGKQLPLLGELAERTSRGWLTHDRNACWDRFQAEYPGPRGLASYWTATGEISAHAGRVLDAVEEHDGGTLALSGDLAADHYAPWRRPTRLIAYVAVQPPLERHGFASVRADDATIELRVPKDPTILAMARRTSDSQSTWFADPAVSAWDLARTPGGDVDAAVDQLRKRALTGRLWR